jgi:hypothetical protein
MATKSTIRPADRRAELGRAAPSAERPRAASEPGLIVLVCIAAWAVPGGAHFWLGKRQKAAVFFVALLIMYAAGLLLHGRLFPFDVSEPLVLLGALSNAAVGLPWLLSVSMGLGKGVVTAVSWEYANIFLIVAGLLNTLVILDAYDVAIGRK